MTTTDFDRDAPLRRALAPAAGCPPLAELLDVLVAGRPSPKAEALRAHAAGCAACTAELALAAAFDPEAKDPAEAQEIAWVAAQLRLPTAPSPAPAPPQQMGRVLPMQPHAARRARARKASGEASLWSRWAAAALLVVGLGLLFEWGHRSFAPALPDRSDALSPDVVRSGEIRLDAPAGVLAVRGIENLPAFAWRPVAGAASYRVEVRDVAGDLLWQASSPSATLAVPRELAAKLETLVTYRWNVTAFDRAESAIAHSAAESFRVEPPVD